MGGIGTRAGAGETQIEIDRRLIRSRISRLKSDLAVIEKQRKGKAAQEIAELSSEIYSTLH